MKTAFRFLLVTLLALSRRAVAEQECSVGETGECVADGGENCPDREHIIRCAGKYLDTNENGKLDRDELDAKQISTLPWYGRGILKILGSTDTMMRKCDSDKDGAISMDYDMHNNQETCLATCFKRRAFKGAFFPDCKL